MDRLALALHDCICQILSGSCASLYLFVIKPTAVIKGFDKKGANHSRGRKPPLAAPPLGVKPPWRKMLTFKEYLIDGTGRPAKGREESNDL